MRIAVCVAHTGMIRARCAEALNELVAHTLGQRITYNGAVVQPQFVFLYEEAGPLEFKRNLLARRALETGADYHLLIDWDHTFPPDAFLRLAQHDVPIVGANYLMRHETREPAAFRAQNERAFGAGLEQAAAIGLGFCLIKAQVFIAIPMPWFQTTFGDDGTSFTGEDVEFCNKAREAGIPVYVDHDLDVGHIAETVLTLGEGSTDARSPAADSSPR